MEPHNKDIQPKGTENSIQADITDPNKNNPDMVDAIKTGDDKQENYHDKPYDEQMAGSFDDLREQLGTTADDLSKEESE